MQANSSHTIPSHLEFKEETSSNNNNNNNNISYKFYRHSPPFLSLFRALLSYRSILFMNFCCSVFVTSFHFYLSLFVRRFSIHPKKKLQQRQHNKCNVTRNLLTQNQENQHIYSHNINIIILYTDMEYIFVCCFIAAIFLN